MVLGVKANDLVSYEPDSNTLVVKRTTNLDLFEQIATFDITIESPSFTDAISTLVVIRYESAGPTFDLYL